jgi:hypothetical protein
MPYSILIPVLFVGLVALALVYFRRQPFWPALLLTTGLAPVAGELLVSLRRPIFLDRTLIWASIPYYLLLAAGLLQLRRRPLLLAILSALMVINDSSLARYYASYQKEQWREATAYVCERAGEQDLVVICAGYDASAAFEYYHERCPKPLARRAIKVTVDTLLTLPDLSSGRPRVWLVCLNWPAARQVLVEVLKGDLHLAGDQTFHTLRVLEFVRE